MHMYFHVRVGVGSGNRQHQLGWSNMQGHYGGTYAHCQVSTGELAQVKVYF